MDNGDNEKRHPAKLRVVSKNGKLYLELSDGSPSSLNLRDGEELELYPLRDGFYLLSQNLDTLREHNEYDEQSSHSKNAAMKLLSKLGSIKFENRTIPAVDRMLSEEEKRILEMLIKRNYINVFKSKKYPQGVYNISKKAYEIIRSMKKTSQQKSQQKSKEARTKKEENKNYPKQTNNYLNSIYSKGYLVLKNKQEAMEASNMLREDMKRGRLKGIKGFDGKFYILSTKYFQKVKSKLIKLLYKNSQPITPKEAAGSTGEDELGCKATLLLMAEQGDVIEKRRGKYQLVE